MRHNQSFFIICPKHPVYRLQSQLKLNSPCFRRGFIAHRTGIAEVMGSNPIGASEFFCNCLSYFTTAKIFHFYFLSAVHDSCDLYHIHFKSQLTCTRRNFRNPFRISCVNLVKYRIIEFIHFAYKP